MNQKDINAAVDYLYTRAYVLGALIGRAGSLSVAQCATTKVMESETLESLQSADEALRSRVTEILRTCTP